MADFIYGEDRLAGKTPPDNNLLGVHNGPPVAADGAMILGVPVDLKSPAPVTSKVAVATVCDR